MIKRIIAVAVSAIVLALSAVVYSYIPHNIKYDIKKIESVGSNLEVVSKTGDTITVKKTTAGDLKVLMFTDMHLDGKDKPTTTTVTHFVNNIQEEKPDLVLIGGDIITSGLNRGRAKQFCEIMEKLGVYWTGVLGNHEGDNIMSITRPEMMKIFTSYDHCLMLKGPENIWGNCNYNLNVLGSDNKLIKTFYFLDSGNDAEQKELDQYNVPPQDRHLYDGVKENQVQWYKEKLAENLKIYGDKNESVLVLHIPPYQVREYADTTEFLYGQKLEGVAGSCFDSGLFDALKEGKNTTKVFYGHDHLNTFAINIDGIVFSYIEPSGYSSYTTESKLGYEEKDWLQGYTKLEINSKGDITHTQIRNSAK